MAYLVLVRHGLSEYNKIGIWAGWENPPLAPEGFEQAQRTGNELKDIHFDYGYTSDQIRSEQTLSEILKTIGQESLPITISAAIKERNYGIYTHKNKWQVKEEVGEEGFQKLRRGWDFPPPQGESLKMVYERFVPYYEQEILPKLTEGKNVILASSGNSLRSFVKYLENISDTDIANLEIGTGEAYVYQIDENGNMVHKEIRGVNENKGKV